ncbi:MAG TPA: phosphonate ABC transporter ATP-binding protein [Blastocatellia bacterium]|nr:phosphonate ABC transporter ATP-binding protein [Blastocatellia bacterium]
MIYSLSEVTRSYQTRSGPVNAVAGLSFEVRKGERLALVGPSGAGKTTLFRLLNATLRPSGGILRFDGRDVASLAGRDLRAMRRRIGTIYQQHHLVPSLSALENTLCGRLGSWSLLHTIRSAIRPGRQEAEQAVATLESVGLADKRFARADELSGGQQQRLAIARVLMQDPDVILADEPFASLDPALTESIGSLLLNIAEKERRTLVVTLHDVEMALRYFPRLVALQDGRLAFDAPSAEVSPEALEALYSRYSSSSETASSEFEQPDGPNCSDPKFQRNCAR